MIEERWPQIEATEPELLAYHYTEAKQPEKAIPLWQQAGSLTLKRLALAEAVAQLNKGLELVISLPRSPERDGKEVDLRVLLGTAWMALKGWAAQEVWDSLHPALKLANALRRNDALLPILFGLWCRRIRYRTFARVASLGRADIGRGRRVPRPGSSDPRALLRRGLLFISRRSDQSPGARGPSTVALQRRAARPFGAHYERRRENRRINLGGMGYLDARLPRASHEDDQRGV